MTSRQIQRHDQFFQHLLDKPDTAGALLRERLPAEVARLLVDEPPELMPGTFVSRRLKGYRTDRLYLARTVLVRRSRNQKDRITDPENLRGLRRFSGSVIQAVRS